ncbi:MAG: hypothetical protein DRN30_01520 [Thermoplasmata archaeon]|nr:MAG: hypothetical protein DRN30_01520 [Thermoplasmata archaeon]
MTMAKTKYLGKRVKDIRKKGLDTLSEYYNIMKAVIKDYRSHRISRNVAKGRLLLLYRLSFKKNNSKIKHLATKSLNALRQKLKKAMSTL